MHQNPLGVSQVPGIKQDAAAASRDLALQSLQSGSHGSPEQVLHSPTGGEATVKGMQWHSLACETSLGWFCPAVQCGLSELYQFSTNLLILERNLFGESLFSWLIFLPNVIYFI